MNIVSEKQIQPVLRQRCEVRTVNDTAALEALSGERLQVETRRFGNRVIEVALLFPKVKTALLERSSGTVAVRETRVRAVIRPNAGNAFPYPLGSPEVRIEFPGLDPAVFVPWLGGLAWIDGAAAGGLLGALGLHLPSVPAGNIAFGIPCLWREGGWSPACDLIFVARQIHRLLTDPGDYAPNDAMNPGAALYWATHRDRLPFEPPISELYGQGGAVDRRRAPAKRFSLLALE